MYEQAPEVLLEGKMTKAADVYAFGILMFELITGSEPYPGEIRVVKKANQYHEEKPSIHLVEGCDTTLPEQA